MYSHSRSYCYALQAARNPRCLQRIAIAALGALLAIGVSGCNKSDRPLTTTERLKSVEQKQTTEPDFYVPRKTVDYMADLKTVPRDPAKPEQPVAPLEPAKAEKSKADTAKIEAVKAEAAKLETARAETARLEAARVEAARVEAAKVEAAKAAAPAPAAPRVVEPRPVESRPAEPPVTVATAAPTARPTQDVTPVVSVIAREQPEFPRDAIRQGIEGGTVRARLTIGTNGDVTKVTVLQAQPPRIFDRAVTTSLSRWKFNPGADNRSYDTEISFKR
jgi:periplasmic protein TonB